ncbi:hypothetical protein GF1_08830 [Desulfolithobacter dissulfuricans]|uniref:Uncharacterized protein n=1 Tax=Desulfolithobacter dissulfuricans TaxID=2795293 RepID=A0A915U141_9BACT|nr:hypothetical protein GF1_08830 [Desulfolithobacter dissulfuricans]
MVAGGGKGTQSVIGIPAPGAIRLFRGHNLFSGGTISLHAEPDRFDHLCGFLRKPAMAQGYSAP